MRTAPGTRKVRRKPPGERRIRAKRTRFEALDHLEILVTQKYYVTPAWLRIDSSFDLIRDYPRFKRLLEANPR